MRIHQRFILAGAILGLLACGGASSSVAPPPALNPAGTWQGVNGNTTIRLTLSNTGGTITGNAQFTQGATPSTMNVAGSVAGSTVTLTFAQSGVQPITFAGNVSATQLTGTLNGSGYANVTWIFLRQ